MKKKIVRLCLKWFDGKFIEIMSIRPHGDGWVMWVPGSEKHTMTLIENGKISSHITHEKTQLHTSLGRLVLDEINLDDELVKLTKIRKLESREYDKPVYYKNDEFWDLFIPTNLDFITEEKTKEIIKYIDITSIFNGFDDRVKELQKRTPQPFLKCKAYDLLNRKDIEAGITEEQLVVFEYEGELWEMDPLYLCNFGSNDHPWADILKPLGVLELLSELDLDKRINEA